MTQSISTGLTDWLINSAKRNPEGALLLAAGAVLLLRQTGAAAAVGRIEVAQKAADTVRDTADAAVSYGSDIAAKAADTATNFGSDLKKYAESGTDEISKHAQRAASTATSSLKSAVDNIVRDQPLLIALAGIAAGAGVAAVFPTSNLEKKALDPVSKQVGDAVQYARNEAKEALGRASDKLQEVAQDKGLTSDGLKKMAGEVVSAVGTPTTNTSKASQ